MATSKPMKEGVAGRGGGGGGAPTHQRNKSTTTTTTTTPHSGRRPPKQSSLPNSPGRSPPPPSQSTAGASAVSFLRPTVSSSRHQHNTTTTTTTTTTTPFSSTSTHKKQSTTKAPLTTLKDSKEKTPKASSLSHKTTISHRPVSDKTAVTAPKGARPSAVSRVRSPRTGTRKTEANHGSLLKPSTTTTTTNNNHAVVIERDEEIEMKSEIDESENMSIASIEDHLVEELPDPVEPKSSSEAAAAACDASPPETEDPHEVSVDVEVNRGDVKKHEEETEEECSKGFEEYAAAAVEDIEKPEAEAEAEAEAGAGVEPKPEAEAETEKKPILVEAEAEKPTMVAEVEIEKSTMLVEPNTTTMAEEKREEEKKETAAAAPTATAARAVRRKETAPKSNDVIEKERSKLLGVRKSKVKALVGAFETVMTFKESESQTGQTQGKEGEGESTQST